MWKILKDAGIDPHFGTQPVCGKSLVGPALFWQARTRVKLTPINAWIYAPDNPLT
jgi:hypothetical protein